MSPRLALPLLLAAALPAAEVVRRDLMVAIEIADPGFDYTIGSEVGSFSGSDAFDQDRTLRLGMRWAWARPGSALAPLVGADLTLRDAPMAAAGISAYGGEICAGATWAAGERLTIDAEAWAGWSQASFDLDTPDGTGLAGSGDATAYGLRLRALWSPDPRWSVGIESGWRSWSSSIAADRGRSLDLESAGWSAGVVICWRPSARPAGLE